ncbi:related to WD40-repeat protein (notchless protein) [Serendipita indica DSM 11827]|uniref:Related to WD40-repeat protein (Notchless protein) n=1 Tax=Serendipita indica (strain DSM 11827) TaxID=1109443 RepID=G4TUL7_SERID|nr:related to WD40-repeat protein (notchless protein) [Serendipita indica DSM 11827]
MDTVRKPRKKLKGPTESESSPSTPTSSAVSDLVQTSTNIVLSHALNADAVEEIARITSSHATRAQPTGDKQTIAVGSARDSKGDRWLARVALLLNLTKSAADSADFSPLKGACEAVVTLLDSIQAVKDGQYAWIELLRAVQGHAAAFQRQLDQPGINDVLESCEESIKGPIRSYSTALQELIADICVSCGLDESAFGQGLTLNLLAQRIGMAKLEASIIADYEKRLKGAEGQIMSALMVYVAVSVNASADADVLNKLQGKEYTRPRECLTGTRVEILEECVAWARDPHSSNIMWIKAAPGAGKSAIASSLVRVLEIKKKCLGSSFFFRRSESAFTTTRALWRNVAYDLARHPTIRRHLAAKLRKEEIDLTTPNIDELFRQLIEEPLSKLSKLPNEQWPIIIIDALDECGGLEGAHSEDRRDLMETLLLWSKVPNCKLIVTSREEEDIARTFALNRPYIIELLTGQSTVDQAKRDIQAFLRENLRKTATRFSQPPVEWPAPTEIGLLATRANGLFIWASTVVEYVGRGDPKERLDEIVNGERVRGMSELYTTVLRGAFPDAEGGPPEKLRTILAVIIVAKETLGTRGLADLLGVNQWAVEHVCHGLRPVLETEGGLRFRHESFVDFLLETDTTYLIPPLTTNDCHGILAYECLRVMKERLRFNICEISSSHLLNGDVLKTLPSIEAHIPSHLQYASHYWMDHLRHIPASKMIMELVRHILEFKFLAWLEVASLCGFMDEVQSILSMLHTWLKVNGINDLVSLAMDMRQFIAHFSEVITQSASHIYVSALPLSPPSSLIRQRYQTQYPNTLVVTAGGYERWSPLLMTYRGHGAAAEAVAFSPDGIHVVSGSYDRTVRLWDAETGTQIGQPFMGHSDRVYSVAFSPDGRLVVSGSGDKTVRLWDTKTGQQTCQPFGHSGWVYSVAFSPDGHRIVSGSTDQTIRLWDPKTGTQIGQPLEGHTHIVRSVAFSPNGRRIVSGSDDETVRLWDADKGTQIGQPLVGHTSTVNSVAFSPDGRRIVSGSADRTIRFWDAETGGQIGHAFMGHAGWVRTVAFSPDARRIVSGSEDGTIRLWDVESGVQIGQLLEEHQGAVYSVAFSLNGCRVISSSYDQKIRMWDTEPDWQADRPLEGHTSKVNSVAFSPDGRRVVSGSLDETVALWDVETGKGMGQPLNANKQVVTVAFSPDCRHVVYGSHDPTVRLWDPETSRHKLFEGHTYMVRAVASSPNGRYIASGSLDRTVRLWDAETGAQIGDPLEGHVHDITTIAFSPDSRRIVSGSIDNTVRLWDVNTGTQIRRLFKGYANAIYAVAFSPDGHRVASGLHDRTVRLLDVETGNIVGEPFKGHTEPVTSVAFSPDGRTVVSGSTDRTIRIWDAETGTQVCKPLEGHMGDVTCVTLSPDGRRIVSSSSDMTLRLWDVDNESLDDDVAINRHCRMNDDGWLAGPNGERLVWIPSIFRVGFEQRGVRIIGRCRRLKMDVSRFVHGEEWTRVKDGGRVLSDYEG